MAKKPEFGVRSKAIRDYLTDHPDVPAKEVVAKLKERGVRVKLSLVNAIKYRSSRKRKRRRKAGAPGVNKSEAIRAYFREHPSATAGQVIPALEAQGILVSESLVNAVKLKMAVRAKLADEPSPEVTAGISTTDLLDAKRFSEQLGGIEQARQALNLLQHLR